MKLAKLFDASDMPPELNQRYYDSSSASLKGIHRYWLADYDDFDKQMAAWLRANGATEEDKTVLIEYDW